MNRQIHKLKNYEKLRIKIRNIDIVKRFKNNMKYAEGLQSIQSLNLDFVGGNTLHTDNIVAKIKSTIVAKLANELEKELNN